MLIGFLRANFFLTFSASPLLLLDESLVWRSLSTLTDAGKVLQGVESTFSAAVVSVFRKEVAVRIVDNFRPVTFLPTATCSELDLFSFALVFFSSRFLEVVASSKDLGSDELSLKGRIVERSDFKRVPNKYQQLLSTKLADLEVSSGPSFGSLKGGFRVSGWTRIRPGWDWTRKFDSKVVPWIFPFCSGSSVTAEIYIFIENIINF